MSTKINARSPFYILAEEPIVFREPDEIPDEIPDDDIHDDPITSLGTFTCETAGLSNFSVSSNGVINDPTIRIGTILSKDQNTSFAVNTTGSPITRTVNYTIIIPSNYTNASDTTIVCPQTFDQPSQTAQEDPVQNDHCPTFSGTISDITGLDSTGSSITLNTFFSEGSTANINNYRVILQSGATGISHSFSGSGLNQTLTFTTGLTCTSATFVVEAQNDEDNCVAISNPFTVTAVCPSITLTCDTDDETNDAINLQGGSIEADGTIHVPSFNGGTGILSIKRIEDAGDVDVTSGYSENSTGSARNVTLTFIFDIPDHYSNSGEIECDKTFSQPTTIAPLEELVCGDDRIVYQGFRIAPTGDIVEGDARVLVDGVSASFTVNTLGVGTGTVFPEVETETPRTVGVTITVPSGWSNAGSTIGGTIGSACNRILQQPRSTNPCSFVSGTYYITNTGFNQFCDICDSVFLTGLRINGSPQLNENACYAGNPFNGGNKWFGLSLTQGTQVGNVGTTFEAIKISEFGIVLDRAQVNCTSGSCIGGISDIL